MVRGEPVVAGGYYQPDSWLTQKGKAVAMIGAVAERGDFVRCPGLELFPLPLVPGAAAAGSELPNWLPYMTTGLLKSIAAANKISALNVKVWLDSPPLRLAAALLDHCLGAFDTSWDPYIYGTCAGARRTAL